MTVYVCTIQTVLDDGKRQCEHCECRLVRAFVHLDYFWDPPALIVAVESVEERDKVRPLRPLRSARSVACLTTSSFSCSAAAASASIAVLAECSFPSVHFSRLRGSDDFSLILVFVRSVRGDLARSPDTRHQKRRELKIGAGREGTLGRTRYAIASQIPETHLIGSLSSSSPLRSAPPPPPLAT